MSLLTPERVPVKVYRWDDADAPQLDRSAGCVATIFKACLVTGYGAKEGAGWTMPFEDASAGVKVLRPEVSPHTDFYLRLSADTGTEMAAQVYLNMSDANTGDLKLELNTVYKHSVSSRLSPTKWLLLATSRAVWFFIEHHWSTETDQPTSGTYFFCGDVEGKKSKAVYMQHTAGTNTFGGYSSLLRSHEISSEGSSSANYAQGKLLEGNTVKSVDAKSLSYWSGDRARMSHFTLAPIAITDADDLYFLPGIYVNAQGVASKNFDIVKAITGDDFIVFGTTPVTSTNFYINADRW